jgi:hypothetical protein
MDILVSFCNVWTPGRPALGVLNTETSNFRVIQLPREVTHCYGIRGLAASERYIYAVLQETPLSPPGLLVLDHAHLSLLSHYDFRSTGDVHSLWASGDAVYAVSTGTDEVIELQLRDDVVVSERVFWRPEPGATRADHHHLNGICGWRGDVLVSGFGKKTGQLWSSAASGFIVNLSTGEKTASGIEQPHSVIALGDKVAYCESRNMAVQILGEGGVHRLPGYTRGLCLVGGKLFVGTSRGRRVSKSTGIMNHPGDPGEPGGQCGISRLSADDLEVEENIDLSAYGEEVYDLLAVQETEGWPAASVDSLPPFDTHWNQQIQMARQEIAALVPPEQALILVDQNKFGSGEIVAGRRRLSFLEQGGQYKGAPANDEMAIREFDRLRRSGANFIVFGWPAFWWFERYPALYRHLRSRFRCALENERLVAFDLSG